MRTSKYIILMICVVISLVGCASAPTEERFSMLTPAKEILSCNRFVVVPTSVMQEYVPSGDSEIDGYLQSNAEIWQQEVAEFMVKKFNEKGMKPEIIQIRSAEFKEKLSAGLKRNGRNGFMNPSTGTLDETFIRNIMTDLSKEYGATMVTPRLILKNASIGHLGGLSAPKAKWDGVSRGIETGGAKVGRLFGLGGGDRFVSGSLPVYSLSVAAYNEKGMQFWSNGGFDIKNKISYGFLGMGQPKDVKRDDIGELFGEKNKDNIKEAVEVAFEPLFSN